MAKIEIIPAILPHDFVEVKEKIELVTGFVKTVQIDICDGQFVPNATWPYKKHDDSFEKIIHEDMGVPGWEKLNFEIDLMANRPEERVEEWVSAGASRIIIHAEATGDPVGAAAALAGRVEVGIALNIDTPLSAIQPYADTFDFIQIMGIDRVGFQGESFDDKAIARVAEASRAYPGKPISVDGGVSLETAPRLIEAGASRLVVGSAIFNAENYIEALDSFKKIS